MKNPEFNLNLAVVIGINNYQNGIPILGTARQDAEAIAHLLETEYHFQVHLITDVTDTQATSENLKTWLETELPAILNTASPSRLLFYFAGHGIALNGDEGSQGYLIPQDAKLGDVATYLPMQLVETALAQLPCRHCLVILDCCFAGAFRWSSSRHLVPINKIIHKERFDRFIQDPAWQVITSAASNQYALDSLDLNSDRGIAKNNTQHSPFAAALIEALSGSADVYPPESNGKPAGDGIITATELYIYLRDSVEIPSDANDRRQTPQIWCLKKHDKGEFIFLPPGHVLNLPTAPKLDELEDNNPYRGLESYEKKHSALFFGRTALIEKLCDAICDRSFTVVLGASGSGKSSLVKAGSIAHLERSAQTDQTQNKRLKPQKHPHHCKYTAWQILTPIRPGESPLNSLKSALKELGGVETDRIDSQILIETIAVWSQKHPDTKLLLVIDQFEELITLCRKDVEKKQFLDLLADLLKTYPDLLRLVLTLRSDFEPQFRSTPLEHMWQAARFPVSVMKREELREVIEEPASAKVVYFESSDRGNLVEQLIDEVADMPGALPLLSFALSELYRKLARRYLEALNTGETVERAMTWADYDDLGGVTKSLTRRADEIYKKLVEEDPAYKQTIAHVMLRMVAVGGELARRKVLLETELRYPEPENTRVQEVISRFSTARLLVSGTDADGRPDIELAHDALIEGWLLEWKKEEQENLILQRLVTPSAEDWREIAHKEPSSFLQKFNPGLDWLDRRLNSVDRLFEKFKIQLTKLRKKSLASQETFVRASQFLWHTNPRLDLLKEVLESKDNWLNREEQEFIENSLRKRRGNQRRNISFFTGVILGLSILTIWALLERDRATKNAHIVEHKNIGIQLDLSGIKALQQFENTRLYDSFEIDALISAINNGRDLKKYLDRNKIQNLKDYPAVSPVLALQTILDNIRERNKSEDNSIKAIQGEATKCTILSQLPKARERLVPETNVFSSDCNRLIFVNSDDNYGDGRFKTTLELWKSESKNWEEKCEYNGDRCWFIGKLNMPWIGDEDKITFVNSKTLNLQSFVTYKQENEYFATKRNGSNNMVQFWKFSSNLIIQSTQKEKAQELNKPLTLKSGTDNQLENTENGFTKVVSPQWDWDELTPAVLSPDNKLIIIADNISGQIGLFDSNSGKQIQKWEVKSKVNSIFFTSDSKNIVIVDNNGMKITTKEGLNQPLTTIPGNPNWFFRASISPNGQIIATGGTDYIVRLWDLNGRQIAQLGLLESQTYDKFYWTTSSNNPPNVSFTPDGKNILIIDSAGSKQFKWKVEGLDSLLNRGCDWLSDYLRTHPKVRQENLELCPDRQ